MGNEESWEMKGHVKWRVMRKEGSWEMKGHGKGRVLGNEGSWEMKVDASSFEYLLVSENTGVNTNYSTPLKAWSSPCLFENISDPKSNSYCQWLCSNKTDTTITNYWCNEIVNYWLGYTCLTIIMYATIYVHMFILVHRHLYTLPHAQTAVTGTWQNVPSLHHPLATVTQ